MDAGWDYSIGSFKKESRKQDFQGADQLAVCDIFVRAGKILSVVTKDLEKRTVSLPAEIAQSILINKSRTVFKNIFCFVHFLVDLAGTTDHLGSEINSKSSWCFKK